MQFQLIALILVNHWFLDRLFQFNLFIPELVSSSFTTATASHYCSLERQFKTSISVFPLQAIFNKTSRSWPPAPPNYSPFSYAISQFFITKNRNRETERCARKYPNQRGFFFSGVRQHSTFCQKIPVGLLFSVTVSQCQFFCLKFQTLTFFISLRTCQFFYWFDLPCQWRVIFTHPNLFRVAKFVFSWHIFGRDQELNRNKP